KGGLGIELDLDRVPTRETGMSAYEIMLSESQERMLMILKPGREAAAARIFDKYELDFAVIGKVTTTGKLVIRKDGQVAADMPVGPMVTQSPEYDRPWVASPKPPASIPANIPAHDPADALAKLIACPDLASRRWIWEQYDHLVRGHTVQ